MTGRTLEVRRHSLTKKGSDRGQGSYLSVEGVALARKVGDAIGPFDLVIATPVPRTTETALAMGFAVDDVVDVGLDDAFWEAIGRHGHWSVDDAFAMYRDEIAAGGAVARVAHAQRDAWIRAVETLGENGAALFISHGHATEAGLAATVPDLAVGDDRGPFGNCEGFRARLVDGSFEGVELLRLDR